MTELTPYLKVLQAQGRYRTAVMAAVPWNNEALSALIGHSTDEVDVEYVRSRGKAVGSMADEFRLIDQELGQRTEATTLAMTALELMSQGLIEIASAIEIGDDERQNTGWATLNKGKTALDRAMPLM